MLHKSTLLQNMLYCRNVGWFTNHMWCAG